MDGTKRGVPSVSRPAFSGCCASTSLSGGIARNATVVSCHKHTTDAGRLAEHTKLADILLVAVGVPGLIGGEMLRDGAIVLDIGINVVSDPDGRTRMVGDVDTQDALRVARAVSPVPGGVGPITDAWVLHNALLAAERLLGRHDNPDAMRLVEEMASGG